MRDLVEWAEGIDVTLPSGFWGSLSECNRILPPQEQRTILEVVWLVREGYDVRAELLRAEAGYDHDSRRADRENRGLSCRL